MFAAHLADTPVTTAPQLAMDEASVQSLLPPTIRKGAADFRSPGVAQHSAHAETHHRDG